MKKTKLIILFSFLVIGAKAQSLLGANHKEILNYMSSRKAILKVDEQQSFFTDTNMHHIMIYFFPKTEYENTNIYAATFYLTKKDKCYWYYMEYTNDKNLNKLTDSLNNSPGLKTVKEKKAWMNTAKNYKIMIMPISFTTPNFVTKPTAYGLGFKKIDVNK